MYKPYDKIMTNLDTIDEDMPTFARTFFDTFENNKYVK